MKTPADIDVTAEMALEVQLGILALESGLGRPVDVPGLDRVDNPEFGHDQPYGPMSPWVVTHARAMLGLPHVDILTAHMELAAHAVPSKVTAAALTMVADGAGRTATLEPIRFLAGRVTTRLQERRDWREEIGYRAEDLGLSQRAARRYLAGHLGAFVEQVLGACAVEDVMPSQLRLQSLGPWRCIASPTEDDPGPDWICSERTASTLRGFFTSMDEESLVGSLNLVLLPSDPDEDALMHRIIGSTLVRAASPPPLAEIVGPGLVDVLTYRAGRSYVDQLARLIAGLCEPPGWLSPNDLDAARRRFDPLGIDWPCDA